MASALMETPAYRNTMAALERVKRVSEQGVEYWMGREIHAVLGYLVWDKFIPVIEKASQSFAASGVESSHHIAQASKLMGGGKGAQREGVDYFLSRGACYLIAINGDPTKPEIAAAQAYFAIQTRRAEIADQEARDRKRLDNRERVSKAVRRVTDVARDAGVERYSLFHGARWHGLYEATVEEVKRKKGLPAGEDLLDRAGPMELSAHEFQMNLAAEKLLNDRVTGEENCIRLNREVAGDVRKLVMDKAGVKLEDLPLEPDHIKDVKRRVQSFLNPLRKLRSPKG